MRMLGVTRAVGLGAYVDKVNGSMIPYDCSCDCPALIMGIVVAC